MVGLISHVYLTGDRVLTATWLTMSLDSIAALLHHFTVSDLV